MDVIEGDVRFFENLKRSFRQEMRLPILATWLRDRSSVDSTTQEKLRQLDLVLERQYYTHQLVALRLQACEHAGINPVFHVDWLWHTHVIAPLKLQKACVDTFGEILDHTPGGPPLGNSRPIWQFLFGGTPADEIMQLMEPFLGPVKIDITGVGGDVVATLELDGSEQVDNIKNMIELAGGPLAGRQQLLLPGSTTVLVDGQVSDVLVCKALTVVTCKLTVKVVGVAEIDNVELDSDDEVKLDSLTMWLELEGDENEYDILHMLEERDATDGNQGNYVRHFWRVEISGGSWGNIPYGATIEVSDPNCS